MLSYQSGKESKAEWTVGLFLWGCLSLILYSVIPLLTILAGILTIIRGLTFWGLAIIILGVMALIGPFYAGARSSLMKEESSEKVIEE